MKKSYYPILEFDNDEGILKPEYVENTRFTGYKLVITFFDEVIRKLENEKKIIQVLEIGWETKVKIYQFAEQKILLVRGIMGGSACASMLDLMIAMGINAVVFCGGAGVINNNLQVGEIILVEGAIRDDGVSYHYAKPSRYIYTDKCVTDKIQSYLEEQNVSFVRGITWTIDALFRETKKRWN